MTWTQFMDMHSGGGLKEKPYQYIYIEAPEQEAKIIFYNRFGHNPERVSCTCCGNDYSITESQTLEQATGYNRNCEYVYCRPDGTECQESEAWRAGHGKLKGYSSRYVERQDARHMDIRKRCKSTSVWGLYITLEDYLKNPDVLLVPASHIKPEQRKGSVPEQGYVWVE